MLICKHMCAHEPVGVWMSRELWNIEGSTATNESMGELFIVFAFALIDVSFEGGCVMAAGW